MKVLSCFIGVIGILLVIYAVVGRFVGDPSVLGFVFPLETKTVVLGANTLLLIAIFMNLCSKK